MSERRVLITAFGDFEGGFNCSAQVLDALAARHRRRALPLPRRFVRLPVDTEAIRTLLCDACGTAPTHVVMLGQAAGRSGISLERVARNRRHFEAPDAAGRLGDFGPVTPGGPAERRTNWRDLDGARAAIRATGIAAEMSDDAGTHLCNQSLYLALELSAANRFPFQALFVHLPLSNDQVAAGLPAALRNPGCAALAVDAMADAVETLIEHAA